MSAHDDDRFRELRHSFEQDASEHDGVYSVVNLGMSGLQLLLAKVNGQIDETALQEALVAKGWEASKAFTFDELCELHNTLSVPATTEQNATRPELPNTAGNTMSPQSESAVNSEEAASLVASQSVPSPVAPLASVASASAQVSAAKSVSSVPNLGVASGDTREISVFESIIDVPVPCSHKATSHETAERTKVVFFLARLHVVYNTYMVVVFSLVCE